jgi:hypothetical protein
MKKEKILNAKKNIKNTKRKIVKKLNKVSNKLQKTTKQEHFKRNLAIAIFFIIIIIVAVVGSIKIYIIIQNELNNKAYCLTSKNCKENFDCNYYFKCVCNKKECLNSGKFSFLKSN